MARRGRGQPEGGVRWTVVRRAAEGKPPGQSARAAVHRGVEDGMAYLLQHFWPRLSRVSWKLRWRSPARTGREVGVGRPPRHHRQGTAVTKKYQKQKIDTPAG